MLVGLPAVAMLLCPWLPFIPLTCAEQIRVVKLFFGILGRGLRMPVLYLHPVGARNAGQAITAKSTLLFDQGVPKHLLVREIIEGGAFGSAVLRKTAWLARLSNRPHSTGSGR